jgi:hypothetical protein
VPSHLQCVPALHPATLPLPPTPLRYHILSFSRRWLCPHSSVPVHSVIDVIAVVVYRLQRSAENLGGRRAPAPKRQTPFRSFECRNSDEALQKILARKKKLPLTALTTVSTLIIESRASHSRAPRLQARNLKCRHLLHQFKLQHFGRTTAQIATARRLARPNL